jgi:hypothetical protein
VQQRDLTLDGNAIGGVLMEIFGVEMTLADAVCAGCHRVQELGRAVVYVNAPGMVVRCWGCGQVMMRVVRGGGRVWLDMSGMRCLEFARPAD